MKISDKIFKLKNVINSLYFLLFLTVAYSCANKDTTVSPENPITTSDNTINGTITFSDTVFTTSGGIYIVGAYTAWPTSDAPSSFDTIKIFRNSSTGEWNKSYTYKIRNLVNGSYSVAVGFRQSSTGNTNVMGMYGCDTNHDDCPTYNTTKAVIANNIGVTGVNIKSWANVNNYLDDFNIAKIYGSIRFVDTSFVPSNGIYLIAAYSFWPPASAPAVYDSIKIYRNLSSGQWNKTYNYQLRDLPDGNFVLSVIYRRLTGGASPIMGVYGCDTNHYTPIVTCPLNPTKITINHGTRTFNRDMLAWADTTKRIF